MKKWIQSFLYIPTNTKLTDENILRLITPSVVGIILCMACLAGTSWAWFSASIQTKPQTIAAANYDIEVAVKEKEGAPVAQENGGYSLQVGESYNVTLTAIGTAKNGGYCVMKCDGTYLNAIQLQLNTPHTFSLKPDKDAVYTFTAVWGSYPGETDTPADETAGQGQPNNSARSSAGMTDMVQIVQYGIEHAERIQTGDIINMPAADYQIPEKSAPVSSQTTESQPESKSTKPTEALDLNGEHR